LLVRRVQPRPRRQRLLQITCTTSTYAQLNLGNCH
jgi:hypothetical protein